jgi:spore protease
MMHQLFQKIPTDLASEHYENTPFYTQTETHGSFTLDEVSKGTDRYLTLTFPPAFSIHPREYTTCVEIISKQLQGLLPKKDDKPILVVGLGNPRVTVDTFGTEVVKMVTATAHLKKDGICLFAPDVKESSGIPTEHAISALAERIRPRAIIVLDSLCARSTKRLGNTLQLSNTSIVPGSAVKGSKARLSSLSLGVPVVIIGMPTIVSSASLVLDILQDTPFAPSSELFEKALRENAFFVCPKEIDVAILRAAALVSDAINSL